MNNYDFARLEKNIIDVIKEEQIKLGYRKEVIRLYYPLSSLNSLLKADADPAGMTEILTLFCSREKSRLGEIEVSNKADRFCLCFAPEVSEYVDKNTEKTGFLYDFISLVSSHGTSIESVIELFKKYSDSVHVEKTEHSEFDYLIYFEDGVFDDYRYCLTDEGCHVIYHRFTREDYDGFGF